MPIKTPKFWYRPASQKFSLLELILTPLSVIYELGQNLNFDLGETQQAPVPVICVGNVTAGGSGKTPTIIAINDLILKNNIFSSPFFLTRGYGGTTTGPRRISVHEDASTVGDEPLILVSHSNTIVSSDRHKGALLAHESGADCILMDDGFQNNSLYKDVSFLVIDGQVGFGNEKLIPAGPLREPIAKALSRSHGIILIGGDRKDVEIQTNDLPVFNAHYKAVNIETIDRDKNYIGFAGLGRPEKFHDTLLENNINVTEFCGYADHHQYTQTEIQALIDKAAQTGCRPITTEKDIQRIPPELRAEISVLKIELVFENEDSFIDHLKSMLGVEK